MTWQSIIHMGQAWSCCQLCNVERDASEVAQDAAQGPHLTCRLSSYHTPSLVLAHSGVLSDRLSDPPSGGFSLAVGRSASRSRARLVTSSLHKTLFSKQRLSFDGAGPTGCLDPNVIVVRCNLTILVSSLKIIHIASEHTANLRWSAPFRTWLHPTDRRKCAGKCLGSWSNIILAPGVLVDQCWKTLPSGSDYFPVPDPAIYKGIMLVE